MNVDRRRDWRRRLAAWLVRPLGLSIGRTADPAGLSRQREKLAKALAHERDKVAKVKRRLEALQAELNRARAERDEADRKRDAYRAEAWAAGKELALLRPPTPAPLPASDILAAARARERVRQRGAWIDSRPAHPTSVCDGVLCPSGSADRPSAAQSAARSGPPLRIATVGDWRSPLADTAHPGVVARRLDDPLVDAADVLVFPRCEDMDFAQKASLVPERLWRRAREGEMTLVLDSSNEAFRFWRGHAQHMHDFLAAHGVDPVHAVHLTQDRLYRED